MLGSVDLAVALQDFSCKQQPVITTKTCAAKEVLWYYDCWFVKVKVVRYLRNVSYTSKETLSSFTDDLWSWLLTNIKYWTTLQPRQCSTTEQSSKWIPVDVICKIRSSLVNTHPCGLVALEFYCAVDRLYLGTLEFYCVADRKDCVLAGI